MFDYKESKAIEILVVDDEPENTRILKRILTEQKFNVISAISGIAALELINIKQPNLVLLDVKMPGLSGLEVCKRIKSNPQTKDLPVIFVTGADTIEDKTKGFEAGGVDYLSKPFQAEEVILRVNNILEISFLQRELTNEMRRYNQLSEQSRSFTWEVDSEGLFTFVNYISEIVTGYKPEELMLKKYFYDLCPEDERSKFTKNAFLFFDERQEFINLENRILKKDGRVIWVSTNAIPIFDYKGNLSGYRGTDTDITELIDNQNALREKQEQLLMAERERNETLDYSMKLKDEFLSLISHELRTPLTVINAAIQALELVCKNELSDKAKGYLNTIQQNSNRQLKLVNNILDNARLGEGHFKMNKKNIDIVQLTKKITEATTIFAEQKGVKLSFSSLLIEKTIGIDDEQYEKILLNLLSNAIKFTPTGKSILVKISEKTVKGKAKVCIQVKDEGIGIPSDKKGLIFEKFGQVDSSHSRQSEGSGIGLSIVKMLVEMHDGEITVESKEGLGSTFTLILPEVASNEVAIEKECIKGPNDALHNIVALEFSDIYLKKV